MPETVGIQSTRSGVFVLGQCFESIIFLLLTFITKVVKILFVMLQFVAICANLHNF